MRAGGQPTEAILDETTLVSSVKRKQILTIFPAFRMSLSAASSQLAATGRLVLHGRSRVFVVAGGKPTIACRVFDVYAY